MSGGEQEPGRAVWDFFVSYALADRPWAEWVAWQLEAAGYAVFIQAWDMLAGDNVMARVEEAVRGSAHTVAVVSPDYLASEWGSAEYLAALRADPLGRGRKLLPVRVAEGGRDGLLASVADVEVSGVPDTVARERLVAAARAVRSGGRAKPGMPPPFPSGADRVTGSARFPGMPPQWWNVPWPRNPNFVGRAEELALLRDRMAGGGTAAVVLPQALHGMGGVGKTQLAVEYAYRYVCSYDLVWWVPAQEPAMLVAALAELAVRLGVAVEGKAEESAASAVEVLRRGELCPLWLVVVDNAGSPSGLGGLLSAAGNRPGGHVLVTSRDGRWTAVAQPIQVGVLPRADGVRLLRTRAPGLTKEEAWRLADAVDGLPLALEQAGAYLAESGMHAAAYEEQLRRGAREVMARGVPAGQVPVATTWTVALEGLGEPAAVMLARLWAHLGSEPIPRDLVRPEVAGLVPEPLAATAADPLAFADAVAALARLALVRTVGDVVVMHRLVQAVLREDTPEQLRPALRAAVHALLGAAHPGDRLTPAALSRCARLYPHVLHTDLVGADDSSARAMVVWMVRYLWVVGDYTNGRHLAEKAHGRWAGTLGEFHPDTLAAATALADMRRLTGDYAGARDLAERVLAWSRETLGEDHPDTLTAASNLAVTLCSAGDHATARDLAEQVLALDLKIRGKDNPSMMVTVGNFAATLFSSGEYAAARDLQERVLAWSWEAHGEDHPYTLTAVGNLANTLWSMGDYATARDLQMWVLAGRHEQLGTGHPDTLTSLGDLANTLWSLGNYAASRDLKELQFARRRKTLGQNHPDTVITGVNLAWSVAVMEWATDDNPAHADRPTPQGLDETVLARFREVLRADRPDTLTAAADMAATARETGDHPTARRLRETVLARSREIHGDNHPTTLTAAANLAHTLRAIGDHPAARDLQETVLARSQETLGEDHPTRRTGRGGFGSMVALATLARAESVALLATQVPGMPEPVADQIASLVGDLALALELAAGFMDRSGIPPVEFAGLLGSRLDEKTGLGDVADRRRVVVVALWKLCVDRLAAEAPAAVELLELLALCGAEPVPLDLFTDEPRLLGGVLGEAAADSLAWAQAVGALVGYRLAHWNTEADTVSMHRLLQATTWCRLPLGRRAEHTAALLRLFRASLADSIARNSRAWPRWRALLPHVRAVLDCGGGAGEDLAWLCDHTAAYLHEHGQPEAARPLYERALTIAEAALGPEHPAVARQLSSLASILRELGQPAKARPPLERALAIDEATHGPDHPSVAIALSDLAGALSDLGQPNAARPLYERALAIDEATYGPDHPAVARDLNNLANAVRTLGQPAKARPLLERALAIDETAFGPDHPSVATSLNNLANALHALGQPGAARPLLERALAINEAAYGPDHPEVAKRLNNLAETLRALGQPAAARPLLERALATDETIYGPDHPMVAIALNNLANAMYELGQPNAAQPLYERALAIDEATYGPDHPAVARDLNNLANAVLTLGRPEGARPLLERALAIDKATFGPDHPNIAKRLNNLARALSDLGQPERARPLLERALAIDKATFGPDHPNIAKRLNNLAETLRELGDPAAARPLLERALVIGEATYGLDHPMVAVIRNNRDRLTCGDD